MEELGSAVASSVLSGATGLLVETITVGMDSVLSGATGLLVEVETVGINSVSSGTTGLLFVTV